VEVILEAPVLDRHGYIVDIVDLETNLEDLVGYFKDQTLNKLTEFKDLNPSIEHFCRIFLKAITSKIKADNLTALTVKIWENEIAWTSYREKLQ
jgi:6-pyruvoyltetrahydropterin/6-carboxytetrahydropterin synthase